MLTRKSDTLTVGLVAAIVIALDQWAKWWVVKSFMPGESRMVVDRLLKWTYEQNTHGAFGFFGSNTFLLIAMAVVVLVVFWMAFKDSAHKSLVVRIAFGMIVGGAIGNIVDRLHYKFVVDFIDFYRIWPNIFNVADACITTGVALLILSSLVTRRRA
ncbi:MAG TPA: signal peptidase II [Candidatus Baltobacteraceae bacterium]